MVLSDTVWVQRLFAKITSNGSYPFAVI